MDENISQEQQTADQRDAFLEGWDDVEPRVTPAETRPEDGGAAQEQQAADPTENRSEAQQSGFASERSDGEAGGVSPVGGTEQSRAGSDEGNGDPKPGDAAAESVPNWTIKHLGEERTLSAKDVTPELLQKGLDYDRVHEKWAEAKPVMELFSQFAQSANMSVGDYVRHIRAEAKKASGMSEEEASRAIDLEDREAAVSEKEAAQREENANKEAQAARIQADLADFSKAFPDIFEKAKTEPTTIPQSVWDDVQTGMSLTAAYAKYAVAQAEEKAAAAQEQADTTGKNQHNANRSTGSMQSAGNDGKAADPFLAAFGD